MFLKGMLADLVAIEDTKLHYCSCVDYGIMFIEGNGRGNGLDYMSQDLQPNYCSEITAAGAEIIEE